MPHGDEVVPENGEEARALTSLLALRYVSFDGDVVRALILLLVLGSVLSFESKSTRAVSSAGLGDLGPARKVKLK